MMEDDLKNAEEVEEELTSTTMGNILTASSSAENDTKDESSDLTPSSSTDASITTSISHLAAEDPISSTSETLNTTEVAEATTSKMDTNSIVSENDLIAMNITDTSEEKITENVDDIVQDLENLLGEPTTLFNFNPKPMKITEVELETPKQAVISSPDTEQPPEEVQASTSNDEVEELDQNPTVSVDPQPENEESEVESPEIKNLDDVTSSNNEVVTSEAPEISNRDPEPEPLEPIEVVPGPEIITEEKVEDIVAPESKVEEVEVAPGEIIRIPSPEPVILVENIPQIKDEAAEIENNDDKATEEEMIHEEVTEKEELHEEKVESTQEVPEIDEIQSQPAPEKSPLPDRDEKDAPEVQPEETPMEIGEPENTSENLVLVPEAAKSPIQVELAIEEKIESIEMEIAPPEENPESPSKQEEPEKPTKSRFGFPSEDETADAICSIQTDEKPAESPSSEEAVQSDSIVREPEGIPIEEMDVEIVPSEDAEPEVVPIEETKPEVVPVEETEPEVVPVEETEPEVVETEETGLEVLPTQNTEPDDSPTEETEPEILPTDEEKPELVPTEEMKVKIVPTEEMKPENFGNDEVTLGVLPIADLVPDVSPIDEEKPEIVAIEEIEPEVPLIEEREPEILPFKLVNPEGSYSEIKSTEDMEPENLAFGPEVVPMEEMQPEVVPTEEIVPKVVPTEDIMPELLPTEDVEPEIEEVGPEVEQTEKLGPEIVPSEEEEPEVVPIEEEEPEVEPIEEEEPEVMLNEEDEPETVPSEEDEPDVIPTEEEEEEPEVVPTEEKESAEVTSNLQEPLIINIDDTVEKEKYYSPRITIKPIVKSSSDEEVYQPDEKESTKGSLKMTITKQDNIMHSILKIYDPVEDCATQEATVPKLIIKPLPEQLHSPKSGRSSKAYSPNNQKSSSPRITIKPIVKPPEETQCVSPLKITLKSPKLTIKPILKPAEDNEMCEVKTHSPRITIKPIVKPSSEGGDSINVTSTPKITIKPVIKPPDPNEAESGEVEETKQRIVLKINKGSLHESRKRDRGGEDDEKTEKLAKIKVKISKQGHPHIVHQEPQPSHSSKLEDILMEARHHSDLQMEDVASTSLPSPIVISEESNQDEVEDVSCKDPLGDIPCFTVEPVPEIVEVVAPPPVPTPRKRGRPRKVPLEVREDFKDPKEEEPKPVVYESTRPKRSCRGQSVRTTLGIKPRKPRGGGRGRGSKRGMGNRGAAIAEEPIVPKTRGRPSLKDDLSAVFRCEKADDDGFPKTPLINVIEPPQPSTSSAREVADIVMYEEETRMSADTSSRAQTPAKQVVTTIIEIDESQSSVLSSATTESAKGRKGSRLEVQEPEGAVISADQLAEYYWSGGGPYMLQEQVAQFLGIKSFKRKYPNITRRFVDMQERDFIRESGLVGESMCDLGLTAVNSADILDIMYSDFQDKYEEYCKHQRDRQAKDLTNKQKALSLAASQEKTKLDITQQAVQSAASWNTNFNKTRRSQRKACMDLQTLTIHYPKGKMKQINRPKLGHYPVALVPGQYTDYYKEFSPTEINNLPLNTLCYNTVTKVTNVEMDYCDSQTDGSGSESDSSSSDSDSSFSGSSDGENCTLCSKPSTPGKRLAV